MKDNKILFNKLYNNLISAGFWVISLVVLTTVLYILLGQQNFAHADEILCFSAELKATMAQLVKKMPKLYLHIIYVEFEELQRIVIDFWPALHTAAIEAAISGKPLDTEIAQMSPEFTNYYANAIKHYFLIQSINPSTLSINDVMPMLEDARKCMDMYNGSLYPKLKFLLFVISVFLPFFIAYR